MGSINALPTHVTLTKFGNQQPFPPTTIAAIFDWAANYGAGTSKPNVAVPVNITTSAPRQLLDTILSCRIDNLGNPVPVYVFFPDTGFTIVAPPNSVVRENVETGNLNAIVIGEGFTTNQVGVTSVYFYNYRNTSFLDIELDQSLALWKASATITRGNTIYNQNFGSPALGDQAFQANYSVIAPGVVQNNLFGTPLSAGFIYLVMLDVAAQGIGGVSGGQGTLSLFLESTGISGVLYNLTQLDAALPSGNFGPRVTMFSHDAMNIKLDASQTYRLRANNIQNDQYSVYVNMNFTINPT